MSDKEYWERHARNYDAASMVESLQRRVRDSGFGNVTCEQADLGVNAST